MYRVIIHLPEQDPIEYLLNDKATAFEYARRYLLRSKLVQIYNENNQRIYMHAKPRTHIQQWRRASAN